MATLKENINQAIKDFDSIKEVIQEKGITVPTGTRTSEYANLIRSIIRGNKDGAIYTVENDEWGIDDTGSESELTTIGLQGAINFAAEQGYTACYVKAGTYLINTENGSITVGKNTYVYGLRIPSAMTLILNGDTTFKAKKSSRTNYQMILFHDCTNSAIIGGNLVGDRNTHDYSASGTHESCHLISIRISQNIRIDNVNCSEATGDCICIGGVYNWLDVGYRRPSDIQITNCVLDGARRNNISGVDVENCLISNCVISNAGRYNGTNPKTGIDMEANRSTGDDEENGHNDRTIRIINNKFSCNANQAIVLFNSFRNVVTGNVSDGQFDCSSSRNAIVSNNVMWKNPDNDTTLLGIVISAQSHVDSKSLINGNILHECSLYVKGKNLKISSNLVIAGNITGTKCSNVTIDGNTLLKVPKDGIVFMCSGGTTAGEYALKNIKVINNDVYGTDTQNSYGIKIDNNNYAADTVTISGNTINNFQSHINALNLPDTVLNILNNVFQFLIPEDESSTIYESNVLSINNVSKVFVISNQIINTKKGFAYVAGVNGAEFTFANNMIYAGKATNVNKITCTNNSTVSVTVSGNIFKMPQSFGRNLEIFGATGAMILDNTFVNTTGYCIYCKDTSGCVIRRNLIQGGSIYGTSNTDIVADNTLNFGQSS